MNKKIILGFYIVLIGLMSSCNRPSADCPYSIDFLPCENEENDKDAMLDRNGRLFSVSQEDAWKLTPVINGYSLIDDIVYKVGQSLADTTAIAHDVEFCGIMSEGLLPISKSDDYIRVIDEKGNEVFILKEFEGKEVLACYAYSDSKLRVVLEDGSIVYLDKTGKMLFGSRFSWGTDFRQGHAVVQNLKQNSDLYSFVDETASSIFTFESEDKDYITISYDMELLSAKENDKMIIYDFDGKRVLQCPSKVEGIYSFCQDGFIYYNEDGDFGLMSYEGEQLIRAKYEQLVSNGRNFLALIVDDEELVRLIDAKDNTIKEYDGEEICDFSHFGYNYPVLVKTSYEHFMMIGEDGDIMKDDLNIDFDFDDIEYFNCVRSDYFPQQQVISTIMDLCGNGTGVTNKYGAFFSSDIHCYPNNISFLSSYSIRALEGSNRARKYISTGINYEMYYDVAFDEPIVRSGATSLSTSAWLLRAEIYVYTPDMFRNQAVLNNCVHNLLDKRCSVYYSKKSDYILYSQDQKQLFVVVHSKSRNYEFGILMMPNTENNRNTWRRHIDSL